ncbi:MAG: hypothetical protein WC144_02255 [Sulfurimonas sp.]|jgi:hypothetical protein|nr:hypothetical protein [Sulfurimonadaceae bacterium]
MQRSIIDKRTLKPLFLLALFVIYSALNSIYIFLPPLAGVLYLLFSRAKKSQDIYILILVIVAMLIFEAQNGYILLSLVFYFLFMDKFLMPKVDSVFSCYSCKNFLMVFFSYIGFYIFYMLIAKIFMIDEPDISFLVLYYIALEFFIVGLFL